MIGALLIEGANGSSVQVNDDGLVYPVKDFELTFDARNDQTARVQDHGMWPAYDYIGAAHLHIEGDLLAQNANDYWTKRQALMAPFNPAPELGVKYTCKVTFPFTNFSESVFMYFNIDGQRPTLPIGSDIPAYGQWVADLIAFDPRMYGSTLNTATAKIPGGATGLVFPTTFPAVFTGAQGKTTVLTNNGNMSTPLVAAIHGPCTNPTLTRNDSGEIFALTQNISASDVVTVDFGARTVLLNGQYSLFSYVADYSTWWKLQPGANHVQFDGENPGTGCQAVYTWNNAYMM